MIKTLLINPPSKKITEPLDNPNNPHLGIGYIAAYLRNQNCPIAVIDAKLERIRDVDIMKRVDDIRPDIVGLTAYTQEITYVAGLAQMIKNRHPGIYIAIGGIHATTLPLETMREFPCFDFVVFGEGELTLHKLVAALGKNAPLDKIKGLGFRKNGNIRINEKREWIPGLDELPFPAWDLFPRTSTYSMITSRGCSFKCIFCTRPHGDNIRERSPENVAAEFKELILKYNPDSVIFFDETFAVNRNRAMKIADMLIKENHRRRVKLSFQTRVDIVDYEMLERLKKAGCIQVGFGIESGNAGILKISKKGITLEQAKRAVGMSKKLGLVTNGYFIIGFPYETKKTAWDTINFARKLNTDIVAIGRMVPFPKTEVERMVKSGEGGYKQISHGWGDYDKQTGASVELEGLSCKSMVLFQILGYLMFYICNFRLGAFYDAVRTRHQQMLILAGNIFRGVFYPLQR